MTEQITYFDRMGKQNTDETLALARERARARGISKVVLASTTGHTARKALEVFAEDEVQLIVIPHQFGWDGPENPFPDDLLAELEEKGHRVHFGTMVLETESFYGVGAPTLASNVLRCFSNGMKVCFEMAFMAGDGGCTAAGEEIILVAGAVCGADTAICATASTSRAPRKFKVNEIICMPR